MRVAKAHVMLLMSLQSILLSGQALANWTGHITCPLPRKQACATAIFWFREDDPKTKTGQTNFPLPGGETYEMKGADGVFATWCYSADGNTPLWEKCNPEGVLREED